MKNPIKITFFLLTLLLLIACFEPTQNDQFYPIHLNNYWEYERIIVSSGNVDSLWKDTLQYTIGDMVTPSHESSLLLGAQFYPSGSLAHLIYNGEDGLYYNGFIVNDSKGIHEAQLVYKYPVAVGDSWPVILYNPKSISPFYYSRGITDYSCVAVDEPFITGCDTFSTIVYHNLNKWGINGFHQHNFEYFVYGIGKVGSVAYLSSDSTYQYEQRRAEDFNYSLRLIDYCLY
ncbi:MAG: hypothetical protein DRP93_02250 [Candidatus Neomarinimicrobiota bacterium]|nr:hypothetical protein [Candidatus Neomarinimicrobiota bacterium]RKY56001.1 MAG: hypothetical protein DRP93_02250 [Candidatus Neomarinimicrobiota bacterium]